MLMPGTSSAFPFGTLSSETERRISMDMRTLRYFVTAAQERNITRAAAVLKMSQPPLSNQIRQLEAEYGTELFIRSRQGLTLTETGRILYKRACQILELADRTREEIQSYEKELSGNLVIGCVEGHAPYLIARWISGFKEEFPLVHYTLRCSGTDEISDQLQHHLIDLAVIAAPYNQELLQGFTVSTQPWTAILSNSHPLAAKEGKAIRLADLADEPLIIPERESRVRAIEHWFEEAGIAPQFLCRTSNYTNALSLAEQNVGICIFPQTTYAPSPYVTVKMITDPPRKAEYVLVYAKDQVLSEQAAAFRDYVEDYLAENQADSIQSGSTGSRHHRGSNFHERKEEEFPLPPDTVLL